MRLSVELGFGRCLANDEEVGGEVEVVGDGAVDGVAAAGWFDDLEVSPTIEGPRPRAAWATGHYHPAQERVEPSRARAVRSGSKPPWNHLSQDRRWSLLDEVCEVIRNSHAVWYGVAIERDWLPTSEDAYLIAIESAARMKGRSAGFAG